MLNVTAYNLSYYLLSALFVLIHSSSARAQGEDMTQNMDDKLRILIEKGRIDDIIGNVDVSVTSSAYSVIEAERFRHSFISLPDVMEQEVGVQVRSSGGEGGFSTVLLRGASSEQVVIYLDGIALNEAAGGPVDLSLIPLDNVERIEVFRGSTPLELGAPSIGGAVNIITRKLDKNSGGSQLSASLASFHSYKLSASTRFNKQKNRFYAGANYLQSKNDFIFNNNNGTPDNSLDDRDEKRQNDGVKQLTALFNWKHEINAELDTELRLDVSDRNKELASVTNSTAVKTFVDTQSYNLLALLNIRNWLYENFNTSTKVFSSQKDEVFDDSLAQLGFLNQRTRSVTKKTGSQFYAEVIKPKQHWKVLTGFSQENYDTKSSLVDVQSGTNTRQQFEASIESVSYFNEQRLIISSVLRYQSLLDEIVKVQTSVNNIEPGFEKKYRFINPQLGIKYRFNNRTFVTANIGQYSRAPSFSELFGGGGLFVGNADLKREQSINADLGYTYTWFKPYQWLHNAELYAGFFYNQVDDLIVRIFNGQGVGVPRNVSDAVIQGVETTFKLTPTKRQRVSVNASFIDSANKSKITAFNNKKLPSYYQNSFAFRYAYALKQWLFSLELDAKRKVFYDRANLLKGDDVNLLNAGIRYSLKKSIIDFKVNNIFDENIQYFRNRPTPGLNASLTYSFSF